MFGREKLKAETRIMNERTEPIPQAHVVGIVLLMLIAGFCIGMGLAELLYWIRH